MGEEKSAKLEEMIAASDAGQKIKALTFEDGLKLLDQLVTSVEAGTLPLDRAITSYETGVSLIEHLKGLLSGAEEKLKILQRA